MQAEIITIGDEILIGQIVDTNSAWIGQQLNLAGISVFQITSVSDNEEHILKALADAAGRVSLVIITGGLGPTKDDLTKDVLARYFDVEMTFSEEAYQDIEYLFKIRGREVTPLNRKQAEVPANCTVLRNKVGTAPGMLFLEKGVMYASLPGVPYEMKYLMEKEVLPVVRKHFNSPFIYHRTILTQGIGESFLSEKIAGFEDSLPDFVKLAYLPAAGMVRLRLSAVGEEEKVKETMLHLEKKLVEEVKEYHFGFDDDTIQGVLGELLHQKGLTVSTAESCTGGYIGHLITSVPGSSAWYMGSTVTYSYESKTNVLDIPEELINRHGAVSEEVVTRMVENVKGKLKTDCAVATSGIAGPGGGTPDKPVGTVWIGVSIPGRTFAKKVMLGDNRLRTIQVASETALNMLRKALIESNL
jgi:nicotinamide-nucleotide amidase